MKVFIFAGPTIAHTDITEELDAVCLPPASQGDIYRASLDDPWAIGLIDGYFERVPAVWHKEILWALSRGIHVFGAASMGALRAAELGSFGMVGVGEIFEAFRDGRLEDDDEVTVAHGDAESGYRQQSVAMVDIRATLRAAEAAGVIAGDAHQRLVAHMKSLHYAERSVPALLAHAREIGAGETLAGWLPAGRAFQKRRDAVAMLRSMRDWMAREDEPASVGFHFEHTDVWDQVARRSGRQVAAALPDDLPSDWLLDELRLDRGRFMAAVNGAFARALALEEADRHDVTVEPPLFRQTIDEFRRTHELLDGPSLAAWMQAQELDREAFASLMQDEARVRWAKTVFNPDVGRRLVDELRVSGAYGDLARRARDKARHLTDRGLDNPSVAQSPIDLPALLHWFFVDRLGERVPANLDLHAVNRGYRDRDTFIQALLREYDDRPDRPPRPWPPDGSTRSRHGTSAGSARDRTPSRLQRRSASARRTTCG